MVRIPDALTSGWRRLARVTNLEAASGLAHDLLAETLPHRWMHVQRVADKASEVSSVLAAPDRQILVAAAWLHDIGYAPALNPPGFMP